MRGKYSWDPDLRWIHYSETGREILHLLWREIYKKIDVDGYGGRELRDFSHGGFYFVCAVGGKISCWALVERWLGGTGEGLIFGMESGIGS